MTENKALLEKERDRLSKLIIRLLEKQRLARVGAPRDKIVREILTLRQNLYVVEEKLQQLEEIASQNNVGQSSIIPFPKTK